MQIILCCRIYYGNVLDCMLKVKQQKMAKFEFPHTKLYFTLDVYVY